MWYCPHGAPNQWHYGKPNEWDNVGLPYQVEHLKKREEREAEEKEEQGYIPNNTILQIQT